MVEARDWERGDVLGKGTFGWVHVAAPRKPKTPRFKNVESFMAVKSSYGPWKANLENETCLLAKFADCPHIIRYFGHEEIIDEDDGEPTLHVFLELAIGESLAEWDFPLAERLVRRHARSILLGVKRIHDAGYVHCDLKPSNILLVKKRSCERHHNHDPNDRDDDDSFCYTAKVADLGTAREVEDGRVPRGGPKGTVIYFSPESAKFDVQERPSDVWALGCVVLQMLGGRLPWDRRHFTKEVIRRKIARERPGFPQGLSADAVDFLGKCFKANPSERATMDELLQHPFVSGLEAEDDDDDEENDSGDNDRSISRDDNSDAVNFLGKCFKANMLERATANDSGDNDRSISHDDNSNDSLKEKEEERGKEGRTLREWWANRWFVNVGKVIQRCTAICNDMILNIDCSEAFSSSPYRSE